MGDALIAPSSELDLAVSLVNPEVRVKVLDKLKPEYFRDPVAKKVFLAIKAADVGGNVISHEVLKAALVGGGKSEAEIMQALSPLYDKALGLSQDAIKAYIEAFSRLIFSLEMLQFLDRVTLDPLFDPSKAVSQLQDIIRKTQVSTLSPIDFRDVDKYFKEVEELEFVKSTIPAINQALLYNAYPTGQLSMIMAGPGTGKTFFLIQEACGFILQGVPVMHVFIGDMSPRSTTLRYYTAFHNLLIDQTGKWSLYKPDLEPAIDRMLDMKEIVINEDIYMQLKAQYGDYLSRHVKAYCLPTYSVGLDDIAAEFLLQKARHGCKVLIIDYDLNLKRQYAPESMYAEGGHLYGRLAELAKEENILVMVVTQTKPDYWRRKIIPMEAAAESSRKPHAVDIAIGIGCDGTLTLAKVREGAMNLVIGAKYRYEYAILEPTGEVHHMNDIAQA